MFCKMGCKVSLPLLLSRTKNNGYGPSLYGVRNQTTKTWI